MECGGSSAHCPQERFDHRVNLSVQGDSLRLEERADKKRMADEAESPFLPVFVVGNEDHVCSPKELTDLGIHSIVAKSATARSRPVSAEGGEYGSDGNGAVVP